MLGSTLEVDCDSIYHIFWFERESVILS